MKLANLLALTLTIAYGCGSKTQSANLRSEVPEASTSEESSESFDEGAFALANPSKAAASCGGIESLANYKSRDLYLLSLVAADNYRDDDGAETGLCRYSFIYERTGAKLVKVSECIVDSAETTCIDPATRNQGIGIAAAIHSNKGNVTYLAGGAVFKPAEAGGRTAHVACIRVVGNNKEVVDTCIPYN